MIPFEYVIWDAAECAAYVGKSKEYFLRHTRHATGFPAQTETSNDGQPRWHALKVAQWAVR